MLACGLVEEAVQEPVQAFRSSLLYPFVVMMCIALVLGLGVAAPELIIAMIRGTAIDWRAVLIGLGAGEIFGFVLALLMVFYYKVYVKSSSLRCFNFWGVYREVEWSEINAVKPVNFFGLEYLRVYSPKLSQPLWLPLFLADQEVFTQLVCEYAEPKNPLVRALLES